MYDNEFYKSLNKPSFIPDGKVFSIVWIILYALMFVSLIIVSSEPDSAYKRVGIWIFFSQLVLNFLWSPVFFLFKRIKMAFFICILMIVMVAVMMYFFAKISLLATVLLIPYILWLIFATVINYLLIVLN